MPPAVSQIPALTGVRILAAAWVVVAHFRFEMFGLFPSTQFARSFVEGGYLGLRCSSS
jgi:peptidoglycan/LPS O-acetylase OafA/YrhL